MPQYFVIYLPVDLPTETSDTNVIALHEATLYFCILIIMIWKC